MIAALFVKTDGCYYGLPGVDPWDEARDARLYDGPWPIVSHSPCQRWGKLWAGQPLYIKQTGIRKIKGDDGGCFAHSIYCARKYGGIIEHPGAAMPGRISGSTGRLDMAGGLQPTSTAAGREEVFMQGLDRLERHGVNMDTVMVYMLVGLDPRETWERIFHRYDRMMARGVRPYPMPFHDLRFTNQAHYRELKHFQSWINGGAHKKCAFKDFRRDHKPPPEEGELLRRMAA